MKTAEPRTAFEFTCETCGRDTFVRAVAYEHEGIDELQKADIDARLSDFRAEYPDEDVRVDFMTAPSQAACQHCGEMHLLEYASV